MPGFTGDPRAVEPLAAALKDKDESVRKRAPEALSRLGDPRAASVSFAPTTKKSCTANGREHSWSQSLVRGYFHEYNRCGAQKHAYSGNIMEPD
jgi:hypothetical protein